MSDNQYDTKKMTTSDIREILINEFDFDKNFVHNIKGKAALVEALQNEITEEKTVDDIDFGDGEDTGDFIPENQQNNDAEEKAANIPPIIGQPEWHDYVMSHFTKEELLDGNPTVDGLRRVAEYLIGEIVEIRSDVKQVPEQIRPSGADNDRRATVLVSVKFANDSIFDGVGDVYWGNTDEVYRNFPVSVAETRAEGRAFKRALRLRKVNAAEELAKEINHNPGISHLDDNNAPISETQLRFIDIMCSKDRLNINISKLLEELELPKSLTHAQALIVNEKLSKFQNQEEDIPESIKGYDASWKA